MSSFADLGVSKSVTNAQRRNALARFVKGQVDTLVANDVATRGFDRNRHTQRRHR